MSQPILYCYQCRSRHQAKAKHFPGRMTVKEPEKQPDGSYIIKEVTVGYVCKKCVNKDQKTKMIPVIREALKLDKKEVVTKHHIRQYFTDMKQNLAKVMRGDK